jgi:hypothetical protein
MYFEDEMLHLEYFLCLCCDEICGSDGTPLFAEEERIADLI